MVKLRLLTLVIIYAVVLSACKDDEYTSKGDSPKPVPPGPVNCEEYQNYEANLVLLREARLRLMPEGELTAEQKHIVNAAALMDVFARAVGQLSPEYMTEENQSKFLEIYNWTFDSAGDLYVVPRHPLTSLCITQEGL